MNPEGCLKTAVDAALRAGGAIMQIYARDFDVEFKADESPLTEADKAAHHIICDALEDTGLPVLSEESRAIAYEERQGWRKYWLVDPLDGTKEFIKKNGEFTVNIALIDSGRPVLGVVFAPVLKTLYIGVVGRGAFRASGDDLFQTLERTASGPDDVFQMLEKSCESLPLSSDLCPQSSVTRVVASRSHCNDETRAFIAALEETGPVELVSSGSSLKLCLVAEGSADVYPRIAPTMEWDTAAAQAVVEAAGGRVVKYAAAVPVASYLCGKLDVEHGMPQSTEALSYNKADLLNPFFVVFRKKGSTGLII